MTVDVLKTVKTTCPYCGVGCGIIASVDDAGSVSIAGDKDHPANFGRLCSKGTNLAETIDLDGRLLYPEIYGRQASWDEALDLVANKFRQAIREYGPDSVAFYASGQLLTEDYYVANKLMKGFIGSANIDTNSRLCMSSTVAGHKRAFGSDTVPGNYEDLELCDLLVLVGSNLAWCHPVLFQRVKAAKLARPEMKVVVIDPRKTATTEIADLHLSIKSDGDTALFNALFSHLSINNKHNSSFVRDFTVGYEETLSAIGSIDSKDLMVQTGLDISEITAFFELVSSTHKTVTVFSQGVNQSVGGTDKVNAIINCHLLTGRIGQPGMGPFSVTGQPNAMGGREVGGLANQLAAHMELENAEHRELVQKFWKSPVIAHKPGLKAVDLFQALSQGKIKALWILGTNPVDSLPDANQVEQALQSCEFLVVSDIQKVTDTVRHAHIKLPSLGWGEKKGTVTNSERRISLQKPFLPHPGTAKPDWWQISEVGKRMGYGTSFSYQTAHDIFKEHAGLSGYKNDGDRSFDISGLASLPAAEYNNFKPIQWPITGKKGKNRNFDAGVFHTRSGKANIVPVRSCFPPDTDECFPFQLNTGRIRDHWHTMTRTGKSPKLSMHLFEPIAEINALNAQSLNLISGDLVTVKNVRGHVIVRAMVTESIKHSSVFVPMHWTEQFTSAGRINTLVSSKTDPYSGQPAFKNNFVSLKKYEPEYHAFSISLNDPGAPNASYWAKSRCRGGWRVELVFEEGQNRNWRQMAMDLWGIAQEQDAEILFYEDQQLNTTRFAAFSRGRLIGALFISDKPIDVSRQWAVEQLQGSYDHTRDKVMVLAGRPRKGMPEKGPIICSCFEVGAYQISRAMEEGCHTVDHIGQRLSAGTNCGSCRSEIQDLLGKKKEIVQAQ